MENGDIHKSFGGNDHIRHLPVAARRLGRKAHRHHRHHVGRVTIRARPSPCMPAFPGNASSGRDAPSPIRQYCMLCPLSYQAEHKHSPHRPPSLAGGDATQSALPICRGASAGCSRPPKDLTRAAGEGGVSRATGGGRPSHYGKDRKSF